MEVDFVRDYSGLVSCIVGTVGLSESGECVGVKGGVVIGRRRDRRGR
jgi:hypothetical protein